MNQETQKSERIFGLDVIRATAISLVVFSHIYYLMDSSNPFFVTLSGLLGFAGVELFFVLSGFLIGGIILKLYVSDSFTFSSIFNFLKRRWLRTLPNYYIVLIINVIVVMKIGYSQQDSWRYFFFLQNFSAYHITFFSESWSLSIEEWTYLFTPFVFLLSHKLVNNKKIGFLITSLGLILVFNCLRYVFYQNHFLIDMNQWNEKLKSIVIYRIDAILIGFVVAWFYNFYGHSLKKASVYLFILAAHLFFLQFVAMNVIGFDIISSPKYFLVFYLTLSSITFALIIPVFAFWKKSKGVFSSLIVGISKLSYSIYLVHYSLVVVLVKYLKDTMLHDISLLLLVSLYLLFVFLFSYLLYRFVEKPFMARR